jgi:hypothetical protein
MLKRWLPFITALALAYSSTSAQEARVNIGHLICGLGESVEAESGSDAAVREAKKMLCVFRPSNSGPEEVYAGAFQTIGQGQDLSHDRAMIWVVKALPAKQRSTGVLTCNLAGSEEAGGLSPAGRYPMADVTKLKALPHDSLEVETNSPLPKRLRD